MSISTISMACASITTTMRWPSCCRPCCKLRDQGKIRFLGITEGFSADTKHVMMERAARDPHWDVMMVGFSILNQSARERVLAETSRQDIGVLCMFAVRDALSRPAKLRETVAELVEQGLIDGDALDAENPLGFLERGGREPAGRGLSLLPRGARHACDPERHRQPGSTWRRTSHPSCARRCPPRCARGRSISLSGVDTVSGQ